MKPKRDSESLARLIGAAKKEGVPDGHSGCPPEGFIERVLRARDRTPEVRESGWEVWGRWTPWAAALATGAAVVMGLTQPVTDLPEGDEAAVWQRQVEEWVFQP